MSRVSVDRMSRVRMKKKKTQVKRNNAPNPIYFDSQSAMLMRKSDDMPARELRDFKIVHQLG